MQISLPLGRAGSGLGHRPLVEVAQAAGRHLVTAAEIAGGIVAVLSLAGIVTFFAIVSMGGAR